MHALVPALIPLVAFLLSLLLYDPDRNRSRADLDPEQVEAARRVQQARADLARRERAARRWALYERLAAAERDLATDLFPWDPQDWIADDMLDPDGPEMRRRRQQRSAERLPLGDLPLSERVRILDELDGCGPGGG